MTAGADITTDLEFSLWKGNSKIYGEYVSTSKTVTYEYTPSITATYRINFRLRDYGYDGPDQTFYLDNVIIRNTTLALIEENNYYPFGLKHEGYNTAVTSNTNAVANKFKYNLPCRQAGGKLERSGNPDKSGELQEELGLNMYDYGVRMYDPALGRWHCIDAKAEKYINISQYSYAANNPVIFVDKDGKEIYIITQNKDVIKGTNTIQQTTVGKQLWDKYGTNDNHDIYISAQSFTENKAGGLAYAYSNKLGMIENGKVNMSQFYSDAPYTKDFSSFDGIDVSKSKGKNIHLISMNEDNIGEDITRGKNKFNGAAFKIFHEIDAHIEKYTNGDADAEHEKHGYSIVTKEINGQKVQAISIKKGSDAWNMMLELIQQRTKEEKNNEEEKR